jgi:hypothetical protein
MSQASPAYSQLLLPLLSSLAYTETHIKKSEAYVTSVFFFF